MVLYVIGELWHHNWSLTKVFEIDRIYMNAKFDRDVDIVDHPAWEEFHRYWDRCTEDFKNCMQQWSVSMGASIDELIQRCKERHISEDFASTIDPRNCVPMTLLFRTYNTVKLWLTGKNLKSLGFIVMFLDHVYLYYYHDTKHPRRPLLVVFPQFSGEFRILSVFSELRHKFDILFVCPRGTQCSWWHRASRHTDALEQYLPYIVNYEKVSVVTWSAGNIHFQVLDRYLYLRNMREKIHTVVRLDPLGYPGSNFLIFSGVPLTFTQLRRRFTELCTYASKNQSVGWVNFLATIAFAYLLKTCHGYVYLKLGRMLRVTKLAPAPYVEHHFSASFDPCWAKGHPVFDNDRKILCDNVVEHHVEGFHGTWLNWNLIRSDIFPLLTYGSSESELKRRVPG